MTADRYPEVPWMDRNGGLHHSSLTPAQSGRLREELHYDGAPESPGIAEDLVVPDVHLPASGKPKLVRDQKFFYKWFTIIPVMAIVAAFGAKFAGYGFAALYYNIFETTSWMVAHWHAFVPADWVRHPIRDVMFEKMPAFAALQVIVYNFGKHWPRKAPRTLDKIEAFLRVPNQRIDNQGLLVLALSPLWLLLYSGVGFAAALEALHLFGYAPAYPSAWELVLLGAFASFVFGRRVAKGVAYHMQRIAIRERIEDGKRKAAWWMLWPLRWRFQWNVDHPETRIKPNRRWKHYRLQRFVHKTVLGGALLGAVILIVQGFIILYQANHGPIGWHHIATQASYLFTSWLS